MVVAPIILYANNKYHFSMSDTVMMFSMDCCILLVHFFLSLFLAKYKTVPDTMKKNLKEKEMKKTGATHVLHILL